MAATKAQESLLLAERIVGREVEISSARCDWRGSHIIVPSQTHGSEVRTGKPEEGKHRFCVESIPKMAGVVSFRVHDTNLYLTNIMYGDEARQTVATELASVPGILADNIASIVDFAVGRPTGEDNFEGAGFNYSPMTVQAGPPNKLQMFRLEPGIRYRLEPGIGIQSLFGTYWRSPCWDQAVTQSPNLLGDERFYIQDAETVERATSVSVPMATAMGGYFTDSSEEDDSSEEGTTTLSSITEKYK